MNHYAPLEFSHFLPTELLCGQHVLQEKGSRLKALGSRCLIVTGAHSAKASGALQELQQVLQEQQIAWEVFEGIHPNPLVTDCQQAAEQARAMNAEFIVGIGGGSPLDSAKVVALLAAEPMDEKTLYSLKWNKKPLPTVLIGTTAGTGSEVTMVSVLTNSAGQKKSVTAPLLYPTLSFGDPRYTASCSYATTLSCGLDALCHAMEGYFSARVNFLTDAVAVASIPRIFAALKELVSECYEYAGGNSIPMYLREELYYGSLLAGVVLNSCGAGFPHAMGYALTEWFQVPHGAACAAYLPEYLSRAKQYAPQKWDALGLDLEELIALIEKANPLPQVTMTAEQIDSLLPRYAGNKNFRNSPASPDENTAKEIMTRLWLR